MKTVTGDLISLAEKGEFDVIIQGCNCFCTMGSGIAKQIRETYPQVYKEDCTTEKGDESKLGSFTAIEVMSEIPTDGPDNICGDGNDDLSITPEIRHHYFHIVNMYTQYGFDPKTKPCDYNAIRKGFRKLAQSLPKGVKVGYPLIGAGLAGGDWNEISKIINQELMGHDHTLVEWDQA